MPRAGGAGHGRGRAGAGRAVAAGHSALAGGRRGHGAPLIAASAESPPRPAGRQWPCAKSARCWKVGAAGRRRALRGGSCPGAAETFGRGARGGEASARVRPAGMRRSPPKLRSAGLGAELGWGRAVAASSPRCSLRVAGARRELPPVPSFHC